MFTYDAIDPPNCWVTEDQLWVSKEATGASNERDVAVLWRKFYTWAMGVYFALLIFPNCAGALICIGDNVIVGGAVCAGCSAVAVLVKWAIWIWALVLRATLEGRVAAGKMIGECGEINPDLLPDAAEDTTEAGGRLLQEGEMTLT